MSSFSFGQDGCPTGFWVNPAIFLLFYVLKSEYVVTMHKVARDKKTSSHLVSLLPKSSPSRSVVAGHLVFIWAWKEAVISGIIFSCRKKGTHLEWPSGRVVGWDIQNIPFSHLFFPLVSSHHPTKPLKEEVINFIVPEEVEWMLVSRDSAKAVILRSEICQFNLTLHLSYMKTSREWGFIQVHDTYY